MLPAKSAAATSGWDTKRAHRDSTSARARYCLGPAVVELFDDPARCADMGRRAAALIAAERGALERTLAVIRHIAG